MVTRVWLSLLTIGVSTPGYGNIGILYDGRKVGVIYAEKTTVTYKLCTDTFSGTISSQCTHDPKSVLKVSSDLYVKRLSMMKKIEEKYSAWGSVDIIAAELEQTLRDIDSGTLSDSSLQKAQEEKKRLESLLGLWRENAKQYWNHLFSTENRPEENVILNNQYRQEEVGELMGSFRPVWSEGEHVYTMSKSAFRAGVLHRLEPCPAPWRIASEAVLTKMLGDSPIYSWLGFTDLNPHYQVKEKIMGGSLEIIGDPPHKTFLMGSRPKVPPLGRLNETWRFPQNFQEYPVVCIK